MSNAAVNRSPWCCLPRCRAAGLGGKATFTLPVGLAAGNHALTASYSGSETFEPAQGAVTVTVTLPPAWNAKTLYRAGARVTYKGKPYEAAWASVLLPPGDAYGAWQELAVTEDGTAIWTASRIFNTGDVVVYQNKKYKAKWWTRNQAPGSPFGPWTQIG